MKKDSSSLKAFSSKPCLACFLPHPFFLRVHILGYSIDCVFFSSRLFLPRFRIRQPLDYRRGRIEGHPPCLCHLSYIGDRIRFDIAKDARGIFSPFPTCLRKPRFFMQLSQAIDRLNGIRHRLVQSLQEEANHRSCPHAQTSSLQILCVPCSKVEITCPSYP